MKQIISLFSFFCAINIFATDHYEDTNLSQGNGSTVFTESNQVSNDGTFQNTETRTEIYLTLSNQTASREAKIYFIDNTTTGFDNGYDGEMFGGVANDFAIYTHLVSNSQGKDYAIQSLPTNNYENMIIPVGINAISGTTITIDASTNNFPTEMNIYLEDKQDNSFTLLDAESDFTTTLGSDLNGIGRFYLHTTQSTPTVFTPITNANFETAINTCLTTNPADGMCSDSEYGAMPTWDVSQVTDMSNAFKSNSNFNADISAWDVRNVTNMIGMFSYARAFNQDISSWNVISVSNMNGMFDYAFTFNQDISTWDVSNVTDMGYMFNGASSFNQDLSSWDVSSVTNMERTFNGTSISVANYDALLTSWSTLILQQGVNFSNSTLQYCAAREARQSIIDTYEWVIEDAGLAPGCNDSSELTPITDINFRIAVNNCLYTNPVDGLCSDSEYGAMPDWDVSDVTSMYYAFYDKGEFNGDISSWDVSSVTNMGSTFYQAYSFNQDIGSWDVSNVTNMSGMFERAYSFNQSLNEWDVSNVTNMYWMFGNATSFNQDIGSWDVSNVTKMRVMFYGATVFNQNISSWDVSSVTDMRSMFYGATTFNQDISSWDVSNISQIADMLSGSGFSVENYDALLTGWSALTLQQGVNFSNSTLQYCTAAEARQSIIDTYGWVIEDVGLAPGCQNSDEITPITDANFQSAINNCLATNPVDGLCSDSEYGAMPDWDVSDVTSMYYAFYDKGEFNGDISSWDVSSVTNMGSTFYQAYSFNQDIGSWDVSNVTNMSGMFERAYSFNQSLNEWDVSNVTNMYWMFGNATSFNQDIGSWDVSNVTKMRVMFYGATVFNQNISSWDVSSVTDMRSMFYGATTFNQDISSWDVSNISQIADMLSGSGFSVENYDALLTGWSALTLQQGVNFSNSTLQYCTAAEARQSIIDTYGWVIEDVGLAPGCQNSDEITPITDANFQSAINNCLATNPVDGLCSDSEYGAMPDWDVSDVTSMYYAFYDKGEFNGDISSWDVSSVTNMGSTFYQAYSFNQDIGSWDVSNVTNMSGMFERAYSFNQSLNEWDVSNVTNMYWMFGNATSFNQDIGSWDVSNVTKMRVMFYGATVFNQNISSWDVSSVTDMRSMFYGATTFNQDISSWDVSNISQIADMLSGSGFSVENYDALLTGWSALTLQQGVNFSNSTLQYCTAAEARQSIIDTYGWVIEDVGLAPGCQNSDEITPITDANFQSAINNCLATNPVDGLCSDSEYGAMPDWDVSDVTSMYYAFYDKGEFNGDISSWDVSSVTNMGSTFYQAYSFNQDIGSWDVSNVTNMSGMFERAYSFNQSLNEWDVSNVTNMYWMFGNATSFNQDIGSWDVSNVTKMRVMFYGATVFNQNISSWDVSSVTDMRSMFYGATTFNQDISSWDVSNISQIADMLSGSGFSVENYDALLTGWSALTLQQGVNFSNSTLQYCTAAEARQSIIDTYGWVIEDVGLAPGCQNSDEITPITDANFQSAINNCLATNPVDGLCSDSEYGAMPDWDVSDVTSMYYAFYDKGEFNADISAWDVSNVNDMGYMFWNADAFNQDIGSWDVRQLTSMGSMFSGATSFNGDISAWDVRNVNDMGYMFWNADAFNQDISSWDVSSVTDMGYMFNGASSFNQDLSSWDVSSVTNMERTFNGTSISVANYDALLTSWSTLILQQGVNFSNSTLQYCTAGEARQSIIDTYEWVIEDAGKAAGCHNSDELTPITDANFQEAINTCLSTNPIDGMCSDSEYGAMPDWDVSQVTDMSEAFQNKTNFNGDLSNWDVSSVTDMNGMFWNADAFNQDIGAWDVSSVTNMSNMFVDADAFNQPIGDWDVRSVFDMSLMFHNATSFNQPIENWYFGNVNMGEMFHNATSFNQPLNNWDMDYVTNMDDMFNSATSFNQDISNWCVTNIISEPTNFSSNSPLTESNKPIWGTCPSSSYEWINYGTQDWTVENAEMVTYRDGTPIPQVTDLSEWANLSTGAWCYYNNDPTKGKLYNWYAVNGVHDTDPNTANKKFAPGRWRVPTDVEWTTLAEHLIANGYNYDGTITGNKIAKAMASTTGWNYSNGIGAVGNDQSLNNSSGFNAFPEGGYRQSNGRFKNEGSIAFFWSSTANSKHNAYYRSLANGNSGLARDLNDGYNGLRSGFSVRFVRDATSFVAVAKNPSQTICVDGTPTDFEITLTGGLGTPTYQWYSNTTNNNTGGTLITGATASTYNPGVLTAVSSNYYYVEVTQDGVGCDTAISDVFTVNVVPDPVIDTQAIATQEVCQNASLQDLIVSVSGGVTASNFDYEWYSNTTNSTSGGTPISGVNTNILTPDNTTVGTLYYYVVVTQTESGCEVISATSEVTITPGPSIVTLPVGSDICLDGAATTLEVVTQNGVGTPTYQWYSNMNNSTSGGTLITGATNRTYDPPTNNVGEIFYYVDISFQGGCANIQSDVVSVNTVAEPVAVAKNPSQTICVDGTPTDFEITLTGGLGTPTYQWYSNTTNNNTGGTLITGATASTYNPGVLTAVSSNYYYLEVTQDGVGCDTAISDVFSVEVVLDPVIDNQAIATQEVCQDASLQDLIVDVSGGVTASNFDYEWYSNTTNSTSGGTPISGVNTNILTPDNTTVGTLYYYVVVTQTESGCEVISATSEVTITPGPSIVTEPVGSDICLDGAATTLEVVTQNGVGTPTYQWYSNMNNSTSGGTLITGATNKTYDPPTNNVGEIFYYVDISFQEGCANIQSDVVSVNTVAALSTTDFSNSIIMYPNPVKNTLTIDGLVVKDVVIYSVLGKAVLNISNQNNINVKALPSGVYIIRISDGIGQTNRKFIKN